MGYCNEFGWLAKGMLHRFKSHQNSLRDPASPYGSRFFLALRSEKVRQAQDDMLIVYFVICVRFFRDAEDVVPYK